MKYYKCMRKKETKERLKDWCQNLRMFESGKYCFQSAEIQSAFDKIFITYEFDNDIDKMDVLISYKESCECKTQL